MQEKRYNDAKKEIRSVLLTYQSSITLEEFLKSYKNLIGERLPSRSLGYFSDVEFLKSMPDVVNVYTDSNGKVLLKGLADETSEHIQKLVSKQRKPPSKGSKSTKNCQNKRTPYTSPVIKEQPFLSGTLRAEIFKVMDKFQDGCTFSNFVIAYHRTFQKYLPLIQGMDTLEDIITLIPELEIRSINREKTICFKNNNSDNHLEISVTRKNTLPSQQAKDKEDRNHLQSDPISNNIHKSGLTKEMIQNFERLLRRCPEGIVDVYFPPLYEHLTEQNFDLHELGYTSVIELVDALPKVFRRVLNPDKGNNWIILPANAQTNDSSYDKSTERFHQMGIPSDAATPSLQFLQPAIPEYLDLDQHVPVYVSAIVNPSLFWFQLQTEDTIKEFEKFEKDLGYFYDFHAFSKYVMHDSDITIGATCVVCNPEDKKWYRAVINSIPSIKFVNVLFVDYGSRENIPKTNVYYVRNKFHDYPPCAFKAQLAGLKPPKNATTWDIKAQQRFIQLCKCAVLMAYLRPLDKDTFSAYLCDTSGASDVHFEDTLIKEGFAEMCFHDQLNFNVNGLQSDCIEPTSNRISSDTESYFSSESIASEQLCCSEIFNVQQNKAFSPTTLLNKVEANTIYNDPVKESKRFVKQVHLCEDSKIHVINLENRLFMTCGELSMLLWSEQDSCYLIERLKYKEVSVPFIKLSKEEFCSLFEQCIYYKIPEYEKLKSSNSSMVLYSLESALEILNVFGHPSACLRLAIKNEIVSFNASDPIWKEFIFDQLAVLSDIEKDIEEQIKKLCLYDLKAKNEALKIKKIKLLRTKNASSSEEIENIDVVQNVIQRRMKEIETICSQYSFCS